MDPGSPPVTLAPSCDNFSNFELAFAFLYDAYQGDLELTFERLIKL